MLLPWHQCQSLCSKSQSDIQQLYTLDGFAGCRLARTNGHCRTISASAVTRLSLDGLNTGIIEPVMRLLAAVRLARRRVFCLYDIQKKLITRSDRLSCWHGCTTTSTIAHLNRGLIASWCHSCSMDIGYMTVMRAGRVTAISRCSCIRINC